MVKDALFVVLDKKDAVLKDDRGKMEWRELVYVDERTYVVERKSLKQIFAEALCYVTMRLCN